MRFDPRQKLNILMNVGALGDTCSTFPTLRKLSYRGQIEKLFVDDRYFELYKLFFPYDILVNLQTAMRTLQPHEIPPNAPRDQIDPLTGCLSYLDYPLNPNIPFIRALQEPSPAVYGHLVDAFSISLTNAIFKENEKDYPRVAPNKLPQNPVPGNYAVIAYGATTEHRRMLPEAFDAIVSYLLDAGLAVVLLGKRDHKLMCSGKLTEPTFDSADFSRCIDMIDQTTFPEALAILQDAKCVIGLDNGLIHLAGLTDAPIVVGYTTVDPYYRLPYRHGVKGWNCQVVEPTSACRYCQTSILASYGIPFNRCNIITKECMYSLKADNWISKIASMIPLNCEVSNG